MSAPLPPSGVDRVVLAAAWDESNLSPWQTGGSAHIEVSIVYTTPVNGTCPNPNGISGSALATDDSLDTHKRLELDNPWTFWYGGNCFWQRYRAVDVPNGADGLPRRLVYRADYWEDNTNAPAGVE